MRFAFNMPWQREDVSLQHYFQFKLFALFLGDFDTLFLFTGILIVVHCLQMYDLQGNIDMCHCFVFLSN